MPHAFGGHATCSSSKHGIWHIISKFRPCLRPLPCPKNNNTTLPVRIKLNAKRTNLLKIPILWKIIQKSLLSRYDNEKPSNISVLHSAVPKQRGATIKIRNENLIEFEVAGYTMLKVVFRSHSSRCYQRSCDQIMVVLGLTTDKKLMWKYHSTDMQSKLWKFNYLFYYLNTQYMHSDPFGDWICTSKMKEGTLLPSGEIRRAQAF